MHARTYSALLEGVDGIVVEVQAATSNAIPKIQITGLPDNTVKESRERIQACLNHLGYEVPNKRVVLNLSPAHCKKRGNQFDLALSVSLLAAENHIQGKILEECGFVGELCLDGRLKPVERALNMVQALQDHPAIKHIFVPAENASELGLLGSAKVKPASRLTEILEFFDGRKEMLGIDSSCRPRSSQEDNNLIDHVIGQLSAKRSLQIALAGRHHLLMAGPPGVGKSLLAQAAPTLLPPLSERELLEVLRAQGRELRELTEPVNRPFRSPHHGTSSQALLGGGSAQIQAGEVTLAHCGVLFLDELPQYRKDALEGLREPLQNGVIHLRRVSRSVCLPARFMLIAAMNPCPCGFWVVDKQRCRCRIDSVLNYHKKISGPILDRIDLRVLLTMGDPDSPLPENFKHAAIKSSILSARKIQAQRFRKIKTVWCNGDLSLAEKHPDLELGKDEAQWLEQQVRRNGLSYRALFKIRSIARTIADLEGEKCVQKNHLFEAWQLHCPGFFDLLARGSTSA